MGEECFGVAEVQRLYSVVCPLCFLCQSDGKTHKVSHPSNVTIKNAKLND